MRKTILFVVLLLLASTSFTSDAKDNAAVWVDVRSTLEFKLGSIDDAIHIPHDEVIERVSEISSDKEAKIYLFCGSGKRAGKALLLLEEAGYSNVENLGGLSEAREYKSNTLVSEQN